MNCREAMAVIAEFFEQSLSPVTGRAEDVEMPLEMDTRLRSLLLEELRRGRASS